METFLENIAKESGTVLGDDYKSWIREKVETIQNLPELWDEFSHKINSSQTWKGTFAELLFKAMFIEFKIGYSPEKPIDKDLTLLQSKSTSLDVYLLSPYDLNVEIKKFHDGNYEILNNITSYIESKFNNVYLIPSYSKFDVYNDETKISDERKDLGDAIKANQIQFKSKNFIGLQYGIYYERPSIVFSRIQSSHPDIFASKMKYYILNHASQIIKSESNVLAFLISSKYNFGYIINERTKEYLTKLSRRVFVELTKDNTPLKDVNSKYLETEILVKDVAKAITGIIFYVNESWDKNDIYLFVNPNSNEENKNKDGIKQLHMTFAYKSKGLGYGYSGNDFEFDNY